MSFPQSSKGSYFLFVGRRLFQKPKVNFSVRLIVCLVFPKSLACWALFLAPCHSTLVEVINLT